MQFFINPLESIHNVLQSILKFWYRSKESEKFSATYFNPKFL
jgi:hypothetical protein